MFQRINKFKLGIYSLLIAVASVVAFTTYIQPSEAVTVCDKVNIVYCGITGATVQDNINYLRKLKSDGRDTLGNTDMVYMINRAGFTDSVLSSSTPTNTKLGTLYRNGEIRVGGKVVATDTWISARFTDGSGFVLVKSGVWERKTTTSMQNDTEEVLVRFDSNGKAIAAIMMDCGNSLRFTPVEPKPVQVCNPANGAIISVMPGEASKYLPVDSPKCKDVTVCRLSDKVYPVTIKQAELDSNPTKYSKNPEDCTTKSLVCNSLIAAPVIGKELEYTFTAKATPTNTTITNYVFSFGDQANTTVTTSATTATTNHTYADYAKSYTAKVVVNSKDKTGVTSTDCQVIVKTPTKQAPKVTITKHVMSNNQQFKSTGVEINTEFSYILVVTNGGNIDLKDVVVTDTPEAGVTLLANQAIGTVTNNIWTTTISSLAIGQSQTFTLKAKVPTYKAGEIKNTACVDTPTVPGSPDDCDNATVNVPKPNEDMLVCIIADNTGKLVPIPKNDFNSKIHSTNATSCLKTPEKSAEIPSTGATEIISGVMGAGALSYGGYTYSASRRAIKNALK